MRIKLRFVTLFESIRPHMERVEELLHERVHRAEEPLSSGIERLLGRGKRFRPALVILTGQVFASPMGPFYGLAAAVEMLHTATLIHDDLVDKSSLRRGQETLHAVWPAKATVLAGDYLLAESASMVAELDRPRVLRSFAQALCTMCAGEIKQMLVTRGKLKSREAYYRSIEAKTASLCATATEMAGILTGTGETHIAALRRYGRELGMAFQIVDDVLDFVGDERRLGKPTGGDLCQGLVTLPILCYQERVEDTRPVDAVLSGQRDAAHMQAAIDAVRSSGAIEAALDEAHAYARRSQEALQILPDGSPRRTLSLLAE